SAAPALRCATILDREAHLRKEGYSVWTTSRAPAHNRTHTFEEFQFVNPGFEEVMAVRGRGMPAADEVTIAGHDPVFSARFRIGETTASILAGVGIAVTDIHEMKTGRRQKVAIDVRHAAATCQSSKYLSQPGAGGAWQPVPQTPSMVHMRSITQPWRCK